jgi:hypothetical protein
MTRAIEQLGLRVHAGFPALDVCIRNRTRQRDSRNRRGRAQAGGLMEPVAYPCAYEHAVVPALWPQREFVWGAYGASGEDWV